MKNLPSSLRPIWIPVFFAAGCAALFGWDIHAPGLLSESYYQNVQAYPKRVGLYVEPGTAAYISKDKGGRFADPQTYHAGEALVPMLIEGFQGGFQEFLFFEIEPDAALMKNYAVDYLAVVRIKGFANRVTLKGQKLEILTETAVFDPELKSLGRFESSGSSDTEKIFAKKGGPEMNLNAAIENNVTAILHYLQDAMRSGEWDGGGGA